MRPCEPICMLRLFVFSYQLALTTVASPQFGAGCGNRTRNSYLEGKCFTTKLTPHYTLVRPEGFEPPPLDFVGRNILQLCYGRIKNLVDRRRIELLPEACKATVLPLSPTAQIF